MKNLAKRFFTCLLAVLMLLGTAACNAQIPSEPLPTEPSDRKPTQWQQLSDRFEDKDRMEPFEEEYGDFAIRLLKASAEQGKNEIISPLSLYTALAILSNGTAGDTRLMMENNLGLTVNDLNRFIAAYEKLHRNAKWGSQYQSANGLWFNTDLNLTLKQSFLDTVSRYYGSAAAGRSFADAALLTEEINRWAAGNTGGSIDQILSPGDVRPDTAFFLLNALATGSNWIVRFNAEETRPEPFYNYDKTSCEVEMMHQSLSGYWHDDLAEGFVKILDNGTAVAAILPNEGVDLYDYIAQMDGDTLSQWGKNQIEYDIIEESAEETVVDQHITNLSFPKFEYSREYDLDDALKKMGLSDLFDPKTADLSEMAEGEQGDLLFLQNVKQKAEIFVDEVEVKAAAVTALAGGLGGGGYTIREYIYHDVCFDRPFLFAIIGGDVPLFIGVVTDMTDTACSEKVLEIKADSIRIRRSPYTVSEQVGTAVMGERYTYSETMADPEYIWYKIGEEQWIADQNHEWIILP